MKAKTLIVLASGAPWLVVSAPADIIYKNLQDIAIPTTFDGLYLNLETGAWNTNMAAPAAGWDINPYYGGKFFANSPDFQPVRSGTGSSSAILNLAAGTSVGSGSVFSTFVQGASGETPGAPGYGYSQMLTGSGGNFTAGQEGYVGFRLNGTSYGSMRVVLTNNAGGALIKDWTYDTSGAPVTVGAIQQVGRDMVLSSDFTLASALTDSGGATNLVKNGSGTNVLSVNSSYTGTTTVNAGKLVVNANISTSSLTTVASGATIGGSGTTGALTILAGGNIAPGNSPGIFNTGDYTQSGLYTAEINGLTAGTQHDQINVTGTVNITGGSLTALFSGAYALNNMIFILLNDGVDAITGTYADYSQGAVVASYGGFDWAISYNADSVANTFTGTPNGNDIALIAIPEPRAALLGGLGMLMLLRRRRG